MLIAPLSTTLVKVALLWVVAGGPICATAQPSHISILYHEPLAEFQMKSAGERRKLAEAPLRTLAKPALQEPDLRFSAFGRDFRLVLEPNEALIPHLPVEQQDTLGAIELYRGRIMNVEGSWARISRIGNEISGLIFDGIEYFAIDSLDHVGDRLTMPSDVVGPVIYRLHDTTGHIRDEVLEPSALTGVHAAASQGELLSSLMSEVVLGQQIDIGAVADFEFAQLVGTSKAAESMVRLINIVDGIFLEGLGIHINLVELRSYDAEPDPFTSTNPRILLTELEHLKDSSTEFRSLGLLHLFTGRTFEDSSSSGETLGVANLGTICDPRYGVSVTRSSSGSALDAVIAAHEIGHNFGAPHDAEPGSVCAAAPAGMLMDASFTGSTEFSQCSVDRIRVKVASATCMTPLLPANMTLWLLSDAPPPIIEPGALYEFDIALENTSGADAVHVRLIADAPSMELVVVTNRRGAPADKCEPSFIDRPASCYWSEFSNGERFEATIAFRASAAGHASIDVSVTSLTESDSAGDSLHFIVNVLPYVNLATSLDPPALSLRPDEQGSVTVTVRNIGTEPASQVIARVQVGQKLDFLGTSIGQCVWNGDTYLIGYDCPVGILAPGASIDFVVDFRPRTNLSAEEIQAGANLGVWATSVEPERTIDSHDNSSFTRVTLGNSIGDLVIDQSARDRVFVGDTIFVLVDVRNDGPDIIQDVMIELVQLSGSAEPEFVGMTATGGSCQLPMSAGDPICEIPQLAPGEQVKLRFSIITSSAGDFRFSVQGDTSSSDPDASNNFSARFITVLPQPPASPPAPAPSPPSAQASAGGGGGALDPLILSFLGFLLVLARRRAA